MTKPLIALAAVAAVLGPAGAAAADGLPINTNVGPGGVPSARGDVRFFALHAGKDTVVARVRQDGGSLERSRTLRGPFDVPAVALDGSPGGLSADGSTLVLIRPRVTFPRSDTKLTILEAQRLGIRRVVRLHGDFSFDAISPDGRSLYLIQYVNERDPTRYAVRSFDVRAGRLAPNPVVDPHEKGDEMRGYALTRATSPDGRWAYTLYDGGGDQPFVHALDTSGRRAVCVDLPMVTQDDAVDAHLSIATGGRTITVVGANRRPVAEIDAATLEATRPAPPARHGAPAGSDGGVSPWPLTALALLLSGGVLALAIRRRRRLATG
jgi:hypothetical protein